jgi:hypothetical protein
VIIVLFVVAAAAAAAILPRRKRTQAKLEHGTTKLTDGLDMGGPLASAEPPTEATTEAASAGSSPTTATSGGRSKAWPKVYADHFPDASD